MGRLEQKVQFFKEAVLDYQNSPDSLQWYLRPENWMDIFQELERQHQEEFDETGCIELFKDIYISKFGLSFHIGPDIPDKEIIALLKNLSEHLYTVKLQYEDDFGYFISVDIAGERVSAHGAWAEESEEVKKFYGL